MEKEEWAERGREKKGRETHPEVRSSSKRGTEHLTHRKRYGAIAGFEWRGPERTYAMLDVLPRIAIEGRSGSACYAQSTNEGEMQENQMHTYYASVCRD
jgi:hypothetical protein